MNVAGPHAPVAVDRPVIEDITNVASTKLGIKVTPPKGYKSLEFRKTLGTAAPVHAGTFPSSRDVVLEACASGQLHAIEARAVFGGKSLSNSRFNEYSFETLTPEPWIFGDQGTNSILDKITQGSLRLLDLPVEISRGSSTGDDEVFMVDTIGCNLEPAVLRVPLFASDFSRYHFQPADKWRVIFPYKVENGKSELMAEKEFQKLYPKAFEILQSRKSALLKRKQFSKWFGYSAPRNLPVHERAQICIPLLADRGSFALIPPNTRGKLCPMASGGFTIALADSVKLKPEYILGLLNSSLLFWRLRQISNLFRGGWIIPILTDYRNNESGHSVCLRVEPVVDQG